jgi:hypothetical protein
MDYGMELWKRKEADEINTEAMNVVFRFINPFPDFVMLRRKK